MGSILQTITITTIKYIGMYCDFMISVENTEKLYENIQTRKIQERKKSNLA